MTANTHSSASTHITNTLYNESNRQDNLFHLHSSNSSGTKLASDHYDGTGYSN